ncbi:sensor histidine kinase [Paenibacillus sp. HB172176]|uniref:cache domain-containing sensor histidine kinase n=1 Tax=Paenibacillus sp. HB172176 TaxID=2493690 RepID=UPI00143C64E4|nr:sensor histidine kinase [Paenibacillus sp. HB172176]
MLKTLTFPLRVKFILLFVILITAPLALTAIVSYREYSNTVQNNSEKYMLQLMEQSLKSIDKSIDDLNRLTLVPYYDNDVMAVLGKHRDPQVYSPYNTDELNKLQLFISSLTYDRPEIRGYYLFALDGSLFSNMENSVRNRWTQANEEWMEQAYEADGDFVLLPPHQEDYYYANANQDVMFSVVRLIREPYTNAPLGFVKIDMHDQLFRDILASIQINNNSKVFVTDGAGTIIYPYESRNVHVKTLADNRIRLDGSIYLSSYFTSKQTKLTAIGLIPIDDLQKDVQQLTLVTVAITLGALLIAYIAAIVASKQLVSPIRHLQQKMRRVQKGFLDQRAAVTTKDEIGELSQGFNHMVQEINQLVQELSETKDRERSSELSALQSQMNPHFYYNTLEYINMIALEHRRMEISRIVSNLGKLQRYTIDKRKKPVKLIEEIKFVQAYLEIMSYRFEGRLATRLHIDEELHDCLVPKLLLQPLVENAIEHGIQDSGGLIEIRTYNDSPYFILQIYNDGPPLTAEKRQHIRSCIARESAASPEESERFGNVTKGFALHNLHRRLQLIYGEAYGIELDEAITRGCQFLIRIPQQREQEEAYA